MDRFSVVITGVGSHHSAQATDIDALLSSFVAQLRAAGHGDLRCTLTTNACDESIEAPPARLSELATAMAAPAREE